MIVDTPFVHVLVFMFILIMCLELLYAHFLYFYDKLIIVIHSSLLFFTKLGLLYFSTSNLELASIASRGHEFIHSPKSNMSHKR